MKKTIFLLLLILTLLGCTQKVNEKTQVKDSVSQPVQEEQSLDGAKSF